MKHPIWSFQDFARHIVYPHSGPITYAHFLSAAFCYDLFGCGLIISYCRFTWFIYPYPSGLLHWHWGKHMIAPVPVQQPWRIWVKLTLTKYNKAWTVHTLQWRYNEHYGVSNHQPHDCLLNRLFRCRSKKTSKLHITGLCAGNSPRRGPVMRKMIPFDDVIMIFLETHVMMSSVQWTESMIFVCVLLFAVLVSALLSFTPPGSSVPSPNDITPLTPWVPSPNDLTPPGPWVPPSQWPPPDLTGAFIAFWWGQEPDRGAPNTQLLCN